MSVATELDKPKFLNDLLNVGNLIELVHTTFNKVGYEYISPLEEGVILEEISKSIREKEVNNK